MSSHIQLVQEGRLIGLDGRAWASQPVNAWGGFPCEVHRHMRRGEVAHRHNPHPLVFLRYRAHGRSRIRSGSRVFDVDVRPSQIDVFPMAFRMDHGWWDCTPGELVSIELNPRVLEALSPFAQRAVALRPVLSGTDETLARVLHCMRIEIESGCPSGKLFADGLSLALLSRLHAMHGDASIEVGGDVLDERMRRRLVDYIEGHLGGDMRIAALAAIAELPSWRFVRAFGRAFSTTPHRYVMERRLERSKLLLSAGEPLACIAYALGFSSQGHFTQAYRRRYGEPPGRSRRRIEPA